MILRLRKAERRWGPSFAKALPSLLLALGIAAATTRPAAAAPGVARAVEPRCSTASDLEAARDAFRKGKELFQGQRWLAAEIHFLRALDCSGKIKSVRSYGRWRDTFDPATYLGLTLQRMGCCLTPGGRRCPLASDWHGEWEGFLKLALSTYPDLRDDWERAKVDFPGQQVCGTKLHRLPIQREPDRPAPACGVPDCLLVRGSKVAYCPVIDWWAKLEGSGVPPKTIAGTRCKETATLAETLWTALRLGGDPEDGTNRHVCEAMVRELVRVDEGCGDP